MDFPTEMIDHRRRIFILKFILLLSVVPNLIDGAGRVDINIFTLSNKCGRLADGSVCINSALKSNDSVSCPGLCNVIVEVCLQPYKDDVIGYTPDTSWCPYGNGSSSGAVYGSNSFDLDSNDHRGLISVPFTFSWIGSVTLILDIKHRDFTNGKDYLIARSVKPLNASASKNSSFTTLQEIYKLPSVDEEIHFVYGYRVVCNSFDYGTQCSKSCMSRDDETGHYRCDADGNRICLDGYKGEDRMCIDAVCSADCKGTCRTPGACDTCPFGWNGPRCDQCIRYTGCVHGYCNKPHECLCEPRWGGLQCDIDMDYCYHKMPCRNGATCIPHAPNNYTCICESGFAGRDCEIELNPCWSNPCLNFGTCVLTSRNRFECLCDQLHSGLRCEKLLAGKGNTDPCFYDGEVFNHDSHWGTTDCRKCHCMDGFANCSQPMCNSGDCLSNIPYGSVIARCPANQACRSVNPDLWTCLKWPCSQEKFGQCVPMDLIENSGAVNRQKCEPHRNEMVGFTKSSLNRVEDDLEFCSRFHVKLRQDAIPVGAYPEHICFHILLLLLKQQMTQYNVFCTLDRPNLTLAIEVVSIKDKWTVNGLKPYLMDLLKLNSSGNPYLRSISYVFDDASSSSTISTNFVNDKFEENYPHGQNLNWLLIYVLPSVVLLTIILLIVVIFLKRRRSTDKTIEADDKNLNTGGMKKADCEMQWNNLSVSCASLFTNTMCKSNVNNKKECNLYKNLSTDNHTVHDKNHDKWTNNGDKCFQSSSSIDDVSSTKKDIYIMEASV